MIKIMTMTMTGGFLVIFVLGVFCLEAGSRSRPSSPNSSDASSTGYQVLKLNMNGNYTIFIGKPVC